MLDTFDSIVDFFHKIYPELTIERQNVPLEPTKNLLVVRLLKSETSVDTGARNIAKRSWQLVYFGEDTADVLMKIDHIEKMFGNPLFVIPIKNTTRYVRSNGIGFSQPFLSEGKLDGVLGVFHTEQREARNIEELEKILSLAATIN